MSEKFTPSPWDLELIGLISGDTRYDIGPKEKMDDYRIAMVLDEAGGNEDTLAANAHLIAAAPDMYEALKWCADVFSDDALHDMVFDALAKARGES